MISEKLANEPLNILPKIVILSAMAVFLSSCSGHPMRHNMPNPKNMPPEPTQQVMDHSV